MEIQITKAKPSDIDEVEGLYNDICDFLATKDYNPGWRKGYFPTRREALNYLEDNSLYVAKLDGRIVGSVALTHDPNAESDRDSSHCVGADYSDILYIHILAVHPDQLRNGIGSAILNFSEQQGRQENAKAIHLYVYVDNYVAIKAYERNGYRRLDKVDIGLREYGLDWFYLYEKKISDKALSDSPKTV